MVTAVSLVPVTWWLYPGRPVLLAFAFAAVLLILFSHRSNIGRLLRGEEPRITMGRAAGRGGEDS
jgi:glycerol-3-phosphate acyltransferase PlsY